MSYLKTAGRYGLLCWVIVSMLACASPLPSGNESTTSPSHHAADGFTNPYSEAKNKGFFRYLRMRWFSDEKFADHSQEVDQIRVSEARIELNEVKQGTARYLVGALNVFNSAPRCECFNGPGVIHARLASEFRGAEAAGAIALRSRGLAADRCSGHFP